MDSLQKLKQSKLFWAGLIIFVIGAAFLLFSESPPYSFVIPEREDVRSEFISTAVISPKNMSWHKETFIAELRDSALHTDLADFVPEIGGCEYIIQDFGTNKIVGGLRECGFSSIRITVGVGAICSSSYNAEDASQGKCRVATRAFDKEGQNSGWNSRMFQVDLMNPIVSTVYSLPKVIVPDEEYNIVADISDNSRIVACQLFVDGEGVLKQTSIEPIPCKDGEECIVSARYSFQKPGQHYLLFGCSDVAGNIGYGNRFHTTVFVNHAPVISSCRVLPTQGTASSAFQFSLEASDSDGDQLSYLWDFGDNTTSSQPQPSHRYNIPGTYTPQVRVEDIEGEIATCSTAWVIVK